MIVKYSGCCAEAFESRQDSSGAVGISVVDPVVSPQKILGDVEVSVHVSTHTLAAPGCARVLSSEGQ